MNEITAQRQFPVLSDFETLFEAGKWSGEAKKFIDHPNVARAGGLQSQDVKGEAVIDYRNPFTTQELKSSGFPEG